LKRFEEKYRKQLAPDIQKRRISIEDKKELINIISCDIEVVGRGI